jgi:hypothetical protein
VPKYLRETSEQNIIITKMCLEFNSTAGFLMQKIQNPKFSEPHCIWEVTYAPRVASDQKVV